MQQIIFLKKMEKKCLLLVGHERIDDSTDNLSTELDKSIIKSIDKLMKQLEEAKIPQYKIN